MTGSLSVLLLEEIPPRAGACQMMWYAYGVEVIKDICCVPGQQQGHH